MEPSRLKKIIEDVRAGRLEVDQAVAALDSLPYEDLDLARLDTHRELRRGFPEVLLCEGKTSEQIAAISAAFLKRGDFLMATRATAEDFRVIQNLIPTARYFELARIVLVGEMHRPENDHLILTITAGTSDIAVAEEAALTAEIMGNRVERLFDVGVAGLHRLLSRMELLRSARVLIVVAGMDAALTGVVSGLVKTPVIAVPTSVGYGAAFSGLAPLLGMLNSCSPGVATVNIDNGFGAGYMASLINQS